MASAGFSVLESRSFLVPSSNYISSYCSVVLKSLIKDDTIFDLSNQKRFTVIVHSPGKSTLYDWHLLSYQQLCTFSQSVWEARWQYMLTFTIFIYFDSQISILGKHAKLVFYRYSTKWLSIHLYYFYNCKNLTLCQGEYVNIFSKYIRILCRY